MGPENFRACYLTVRTLSGCVRPISKTGSKSKFWSRSNTAAWWTATNPNKSRQSQPLPYQPTDCPTHLHKFKISIFLQYNILYSQKSAKIFKIFIFLTAIFVQIVKISDISHVLGIIYFNTDFILLNLFLLQETFLRFEYFCKKTLFL